MCGEKLKEETIPATGALAYEVNSDGKTCTITGMGTCTDTDVHIPSTIDGYTITAIGNRAFSECTAITSINIPKTVKTIGLRAFYGCTGITEITIPSSVTSIGTQIFYKASNLHTVYYNSTYYSADNPFLNLDHITKIVFGGSVPSNMLKDHTAVKEIEVLSVYGAVGDAAFSGCSSLESITLPYASSPYNNWWRPFGVMFGQSSYTGGVATSQYVYSYSDETTKSITYYIPASLKSVTINGNNIYVGAFQNCTNLTSITIGDGVTYIDDSAFYGCSKLTSVKIGNSVTSIGNAAFSGCTSLTSVEMSDSVISIGDSAFSGCGRLTTITIPDSVTDLGNATFSGCTSLRSIEIPDSVTSISDKAFYNCILLTSVVMEDSITSIGSSAFYGCTSLRSIEIPDSVKSIGSSAFSGCTSFTSVEIPNSVMSIGGSAFSGCTSLTSVVLGNSVTSIGSSAFSGTPLRSIEIPDSVTSIGDSAFKNCTSLTSVVMGNSVTSIGSSAFSGCTSLTSVVLGNSVRSIGDKAFQGCTSFTSIYIPYSVNSIGSGALNGCSSLESITLPFVGGAPTSNSASGYIYDNSLFGYIFGTSSYIGGTATIQNYGNGYSDEFYIPTSLKTVTIMRGKIYSGSFENCSNLTGITIGDSVISIGSGAFKGCSSLESITLPFAGAEDSATGVRALFGHIFGGSGYTGGTKTKQYCGSGDGDYYIYYIPKTLRTVTITGGNIHYGAFSYCESLTSIEIGDSVERINPYAFKECTSLASIVIGKSVTSIGYDAFWGCYRLIEVINRSSLNITKYDSYGCAGHFAEYIKTGDAQSAIKTVGDYIFYDDGTDIYLVKYMGSDTEITLPEYDGGKEYGIWSRAFYDYKSLTSIVIPDSVTSIGKYAFYRCTSLTSIKYRGTESQWQAITKVTDWDLDIGSYTVTYNYTGE